MQKKCDVFISYNSLEYSEASTIRKILTTNGISCWMAPESIPFGSNYAREIPKAIKECKVFLLILSEKSQGSKWVALELDRAMNEGKLIYPLQIENCEIVDPFNFMLSQTQRYFAYTEKVQAMERLVSSLKQILEAQTDIAQADEEQSTAAQNAFVSPPAPSSEEKPDENRPPENSPLDNKTTPEDEKTITEKKDSNPSKEAAVSQTPEKAASNNKEEFFDISNRILTKYRGTDTVVKIPDGVEIIGRGAFSDTAVEAVIIPPGVRSIAAYAFAGAEKLISAEGMSEVESIKEHAFEGCRSLERVDFSDKLKYIRSRAFADCPLRKILLPESVEEIGESCFAGTLVESITLPIGLVKIGADAFASCSRLQTAEVFCRRLPDNTFSGGTCLTKVILHGTVKTIGHNAFFMPEDGLLEFPESAQTLSYKEYTETLKRLNEKRAAKNAPEESRKTEQAKPASRENTPDAPRKRVEPLTLISKDFEIRNGVLKKYTGDCGEVHIPEGVTIIDSYAFSKAAVERIVCPDSLKRISDRSFSSCDILESVVLNEGLTEIDRSAFFFCSRLAEINFPQTLQSIGNKSFSNTAINAVVIPPSVKIIGEMAFSLCHYLSCADIASEEIGANAFFGCRKLRNIVLRRSVKRVGAKAFLSCDDARVTIESKDTVLDKKAFYKKAIISYAGE